MRMVRAQGLWPEPRSVSWVLTHFPCGEKEATPLGIPKRQGWKPFGRDGALARFTTARKAACFKQHPL